MVFEHIEKIKQEYTDKFVVVDESCPELRRFVGQTGMVRTVNMNGRALVEFDGHLNIGWYDIEIDYLKVIDKPLPKVDEPKEKPAAKQKAAAKTVKEEPSALEKARASDGKKTGGQMSVADVLAAAREKKESAQSEVAKPEIAEEQQVTAKSKSPQEMSVADVMAAARGEKSGQDVAATTADVTGDQDELDDVAALMEAARKPKDDPGQDKTVSAATDSKTDVKSMSVADVLAAARGKPSSSSPDEPQAAEEPQTETVAPEAPEAAADAKREAIPSDTEGIIAWCRQHDG